MVGLYTPCDFLGITDGRWKYIWYPEGGTEQLFDLENDPQELHDLAALASYDGRRRAMQDKLIHWLAAHRPEFVRKGALIIRPLVREPEIDRRGNGLYDFRTEYCTLDQIH